MINETSITKLEETIIQSVREALKTLLEFEVRTPLSVEDRSEALDCAAEASALIKLAMFDSGLGKEAAAVLRELEPLIARSLVALRKDSTSQLD